MIKQEPARLQRRSASAIPSRSHEDRQASVTGASPLHSLQRIQVGTPGYTAGEQPSLWRWPDDDWWEPLDIKTVTLWINAFIPKHVPGVTKQVPDGSGRTMIEGPIPYVSDCFLTDQRDFSSRLGATSRIHAEIAVDMVNGRLLYDWSGCSRTHEVDCEDGEVECAETGHVNGGFSNFASAPSHWFVAYIDAAAHNPCFTGSPDIDFLGWVYVNAMNQTVGFSGRIDAFPAFEMYASVNNGPAITVFKRSPPPGNTPADLFGAPIRGVNVTRSLITGL